MIIEYIHFLSSICPSTTLEFWSSCVFKSCSPTTQLLVKDLICWVRKCVYNNFLFPWNFWWDQSIMMKFCNHHGGNQCGLGPILDSIRRQLLHNVNTSMFAPFVWTGHKTPLDRVAWFKRPKNTPLNPKECQIWMMDLLMLYVLSIVFGFPSQGSSNHHFGGIKQCKCMVILQDFPYHSAWSLGW